MAGSLPAAGHTQTSGKQQHAHILPQHATQQPQPLHKCQRSGNETRGFAVKRRCPVPLDDNDTLLHGHQQGGLPRRACRRLICWRERLERPRCAPM
jgi:hypothetical protein